jgi:hypothetical protein
MSSMLLAALLVGGAEAPAADAAAPKIEGKWLIAYAEEGGRRNNAWEAKVATVKDDTLTYERDGKKNTLKLTFGAHETVKAALDTEGEEKGIKKGNYQGVYIAGQDYFCLALNGAGTEKGTSSAAFILILKRQR